MLRVARAGRLHPAVIVFLSMACGGTSKDTGSVGPLTETEFLERYPTVFCEVMERCSPDEFNHIYSSDLDLCVEEITTWGRERLNDGCALDGVQAGACVDVMPGVDCDGWNAGDYSDSCGGIIDC